MVKRTILKAIGLLVLSGSLWLSLATVPVNADSIKTTVGSNPISAVKKAKPKKATKKQVKVAIKKIPAADKKFIQQKMREDDKKYGIKKPAKIHYTVLLGTVKKTPVKKATAKQVAPVVESTANGNSDSDGNNVNSTQPQIGSTGDRQ